ncbi:hypothetical protein SCUP234_03507 [Seiridium cupressi]
MSDHPGRRNRGRGRHRNRGSDTRFGGPARRVHDNSYPRHIPALSDRGDFSRVEAPVPTNDLQPESSSERLKRLLEAKRNIELEIVNTEISRELQQFEMERDSRSSRRYDDGEVTRYGAGESYRPFNDRATPRRARTPERERRSPPPRDRVRSPPREPRDRPRSPPREPRERPRSPPREPRERLRSPPREPRDRPRSPPRGPRARSPLPRERARSPVIHENRYIPDRTPRRRSRSPFRPDRSRDRGREDDRGLAAADTWRRPQRSRSPVRRPSPRRSPIRRSSPPPRRFSPPRRDARDDRDRRNFASGDPRSLPQSHSFQTEVHATFRGHDRANPNNIPVSQSKRISQSPLTHGPLSSDYMHDYEGHSRRFDTPRAAYSVPGQRQGHNASRAPNLTSSQAFYAVENSRHRNPQSESSFHVHTSNVDISYRGRSRSADRDRRDVRDRRSPPPRRVSPPGGRGGPFRRRSPSIDRRDDRYGSAQRRPSPPRESAVSSAYPSRDQSRRPSPLPTNTRRDDRSNPQSPISSRNHSRSPQRASLRERSPARPSMATTSTRSPPRGPAAFRPPPTGPRGDRAWRDTRDDRDTGNFSGRSVSAVSETPNRPTPPPNRQDATSPGAPPSGPRGYGAPRGGYGRGGRGNTWVAPGQGRNLSPGPNPASATTGSNNGPVPTGPRGHTPSSTSVPSTPTAQSKPFNPPKGPAAEKRQLSVFEKEVATMTPILAGGKMNIEDEAAMKGVLPEQLAHFKAAEDEADRIRKEMERNEEKTRAMMADFRRGQREGELYKLKTDLTEAAVAKSSGEGFTGSAF